MSTDIYSTGPSIVCKETVGLTVGAAIEHTVYAYATNLNYKDNPVSSLSKSHNFDNAYAKTDALASTVSQSHSGDNVFVSYNSTNGSLCQNYGTLAATSATTGRSVDGYLEYDHVQAIAGI